MSRKISSLLLSVIITGTLYNLSCSGRVPQGGFPTSPPSDKPTPTPPPEPKPGDEVDINYLQTFNPKFAVGMKYTYLVTINTGTVTGKPIEVSSEILEVTTDTIKARVKSTDGIKDKSMKISDFTNPTPEVPSDQAKFKFVVKEDIKVTAGTYKSATKISSTNAGGSFTGWYAVGIGMLKKTFVDPKKITTVMELKEFKDK